MAIIESLFIYMIVHALYGMYSGDLFSLGQLVFTIVVVFINTKLFFLEMHHKTIVTLVGWLLMVGGWFVWNMFVTGSGAIKHSISPYPIKNSFLHGFGRQPLWWITFLLAAAAVIIFELCVTSLRRVYFPKDQDLWQELERLGASKVLEEHAATSGVERGEVQHEHPPASMVAGDDTSSVNLGLDRIVSGVSVDLPHREG
jgi:phospholipid-translocating ATPase